MEFPLSACRLLLIGDHPSFRQAAVVTTELRHGRVLIAVDLDNSQRYALYVRNGLYMCVEPSMYSQSPLYIRRALYMFVEPSIY